MSFCPKFITERRPWEFCPHQSYGWLGWTQHAVKFIAICLAFLSWAQFIADSGTSTIVESRGEITPQRTAQIVLFSLVLIPYAAGLFLRYLSAEVFAFSFHMFHMFAHVILLLSLIYQYDPSTFIYVYILLLLMGELIQMMFLFMRSDKALVDIYDVPINLIWAYSCVLVIFYIILLILQVFISTSTFQQFHGY